MLRIQLKANNEREAAIARAKLVRTLQEVAEDGLAPQVIIRPQQEAGMGDWFHAEVSY